MKKLNFKIVLPLLVCFALLTGCAGSKLSDDFNGEEVEEQAKEVITIINNNDSEALLDMTTVQMGKALTEETLEEIYAAIGEGGEFHSFEDISLAGKKDKASEEEFAVVVVKAKYEHKNFIYTISFTKQMKLAGLYYK